jgi:hypothetical protein
MSVRTAIGQQNRTRGKEPATFERLAGTGGLVFAATLLAQNIIRASAPGFGAAPAQVTAYFLHHRAAALVPLGLFPVEMIALFAFVAAVWTMATARKAGGGPTWGRWVRRPSPPCSPS